jgi:hypothetical protein
MLVGTDGKDGTAIAYHVPAQLRELPVLKHGPVEHFDEASHFDEVSYGMRCLIKICFILIKYF